jgi:drug/metabolite transporter (DMT)-like permease
MGKPSSGGRWLTIAGFLLLCLLWAWYSLRGDLAPESTAAMPAMERQAIEFALPAAGAAIFALLRRKPWPAGREAFAWMLAGAELFLLPALLIHLSVGWINALTRVAFFSLVPVLAVVLDPYIGSGETNGKALAAALAAVMGTLLIFPATMPGSLPGVAGWCAVIAAALCIAAANCSAVPLARKGHSLAPAVAIACGMAAAGFALTSALTEHPVSPFSGSSLESLVAAAIATLLIFWLMRRMDAVPMTTRYVVAPLMANLAAVALFRPAVSLRAWLGLGLIAAGAGWLLFASGEDHRNADTPQTLRLK